VITCKKCGVEKEEAEFRLNATGRGLRLDCKQCERENQRRRYAANPEKYSAVARQWSKNNPEKRNATKRAWYKVNSDKHKAYQRKGMYGIVDSEVRKLLETQNNSCSICEKIFIPGNRQTSFHVDHDHATGKVRGLLCGKCNSALGFLDDSFSLCIRAADYIRRISY
jgi:hypothetical protein